jgi:diguanylate cyclase
MGQCHADLVGVRQPRVGLSLMYVMPKGVTSIHSAALVPLDAILLASATFGIYQRSMCLVHVVPVYLGQLVAWIVLDDPGIVVLIVGMVGLIVFVLAVNGVLVRGTRSAFELSRERENLLGELNCERADLARQVRVDVLTGAQNRLAFNEAINELAAQNQRCAVLLVDLDGFKSVNDSLGHATGDKLLIESVQRIVAVVGDATAVFRLGGDEFAVALAAVDGIAADAMSERIVDAFRTAFILDNRATSVGASVGTAISGQGFDPEDLLAQADRALYASKANGRNRATRFPDRDQGSGRLTRVEIERALEAREFVPFYQPVIDMRTGRVEALEALARWRRNGQIVTPDGFLAEIEAYKLYHGLGSRMFLKSLSDLQSLANEGLIGDHVRVHVNMSPVQLDGVQHVHDTAQCGKTLGLDPSRLTIEITEAALLRDTKTAQAMLAAARELGVEVALDDFGTGYSSLSLLLITPVHHLKIDRAFVTPVVHDAACQAVISGIVAMAQRLGIPVTAEGVETIEQAAALQKLGVFFAQGYLYAKPMSLADLRTFLGSEGIEEQSPLAAIGGTAWTIPTTAQLEG